MKPAHLLLTALLLVLLTVLLASLGAAVAAEGDRSPATARERHPQSGEIHVARGIWVPRSMAARPGKQGPA